MTEPIRQPLLAAIGLSHLQVYQENLAPDGLCSGSPHMHAISREAYFVINGEGWVELHTAEEGYRTIGLRIGEYDAPEVSAVPGGLGLLVSILFPALKVWAIFTRPWRGWGMCTF